MFTTLVKPAELATHLDDPDWVVFDCRFTLTDPDAGLRAYQAGHIPGARYAHLDDDLSSPVTSSTGRHPLPDPDRLAEFLASNGVSNGSQVVVYDDSFGAIAARMWWLLRWLGHDAVALLDGGLPRWEREGQSLVTAVPGPQQGNFKANLRTEMVVTAGQVIEGVIDGNSAVLLDARAEDRFTGEREPLDPVAGHVPGALNLPFEDNLAFSGDFLEAAELKEQFDAMIGSYCPDDVIHMCGSGVTACHNVLAMEIAGLPGSRLYAGSWSEWIREPSRPVATGPAGVDHPLHGSAGAPEY